MMHPPGNCPWHALCCSVPAAPMPAPAISAMLRMNRFLALASLSATLLGATRAHAQTSTATVSASGQPNPERFVGGVDKGTSTRPQNLTPLGINYSDCIQDMVLRFTVVVNGFDGSENLQVWASKSGDCTAATSRGVGGSGSVVPTCWLLDQGFTALRYAAPTSLQFNVRVQDLVGLQNAPPYPANYVRQGPDACTAQSTFVAIPMTVNFVPINSGNGAPSGTAYQYKISADLIGPPAPASVSKSVGDTLLVVTWTPNNDSDTASYDVFIDPIPGQEGSTSALTPDGSILVCSESGTSAANPQDAASDAPEGGDHGAADAAIVAATSDADCHYLNVAGMSSVPTKCNSTVLSSAIVQSGASVQQYDDAGNPIDGGASSGVGGLSTIPTQNLVVSAGSTDVTVSDRSTGSYTIKGLKNNNWYNVVVAAVDNSGNVGPPSAQVCDFPALVDDFWTVYRQNGGRAGGGFCALEAVGEPVPCAAGIALALVTGGLALRRRRKR